MTPNADSLLTIGLAYAVYTRTYIIPELLEHSKILHPWLSKVFDNTAGTLSQPYYLSGLGAIEPAARERSYSIRDIRYADRFEHIFAPIHVKRRPKSQLVPAKLNIRVHLYRTAACTVALTLTFPAEAAPLPTEQFIHVLRSVRSDKNRWIEWSMADGKSTQLSTNELLDVVVKRVRSAIRKDRQGELPQAKSTDYLFINVIATNPPIDPNIHGAEIMRIFRLDSRSDELAEPLRHDFGRRLYDIGVVGRSIFLFSEGGRWQPSPARKKQSLALIRKRQWRLMPAIELFQYEQAMTAHLTHRLNDLENAIRGAQNKSADFVRTLLTSTFYDSTLDEIARDLPNATEDVLWGAVAKLHSILSVKHGMEERFHRLVSARESFLERVDEWEPGLKRLFGFIPGLE